MNDAALDADLHAAHAGDRATRLAGLYREAADRAEREGDIDRACFFLTHAWVFALEAGDPMAGEIRDRLVCEGRETEQ